MQSWLYLLSFFLLSFCPHVFGEDTMFCGVAQWAAYRKGKGKFRPGKDLRAQLCNILCYGKMGIDPNNHTLISRDPWGDLRANGRGMIREVVDLKKQNPELKVIVSVGGWDEGSVKFSKMAADPAKRKAFIDSAKKFIRDHRLDGLDIAWQFPGDRGGDPDDKDNFPLLLRELRAALEGYILSVELNGKQYSIDISYNLREIGEAVDYVTLISYQYNGPWESITKPSSPLRSTDHNNIEEAVKLMIEEGLPPEKTLLGIATHGVAFQLEPGATPAMGAPVKGPLNAKWAEGGGFMSYLEICWLLEKEGYTRGWHEESLTPYAYKDDKFISYDDMESIALKISFARKLGLGGAYVWALDTDDFLGHCSKGQYALTEAVSNAFTSWDVETETGGLGRPEDRIEQH